MLVSKNILNFEKKTVFVMNFFLTVLIIFTFLYSWPLELFFYFTVISTLIVSYIFFKRSKKVSKMLILTNLFIFFYFLSPQVSNFLYELFGVESFLYVLFYSIFLAYIFLLFSGNHYSFLGDLKKFNWKILTGIFVFGFVLSFFFYLIEEPVPSLLVEAYGSSLISIIFTVAFSSFLVALAEQMIFAGFLFNSYRNLTSKVDAYYQTAIIFFLFHILRFEVLVKHYYTNFQDFFIVYISLYYIGLFFFMLLALYLYSFSGKKNKGNFFYPLALHFATDFGLFLFYTFRAIT